MTRFLLAACLLAFLAGCGLENMCMNIGSGCPTPSAEPVKPAPEKVED